MIAPVQQLQWWQAVVLGLVEGITEYLPVSSTGHLILASDLMGLRQAGQMEAAVESFEVVIQGGAILAVLGLYWPRVVRMLKGLFGRDSGGLRLLINLVIAFMPAAIIGLLIHDWVTAHLFSTVPVLTALVLGGIYMMLIEQWRRGRFSFRPHPSQGKEIDDLTPGDALKIGLLQCVAMIPGTSRSMMTITGGFLVGLKPKAAAEFSFLLGLPTLVAATGLALFKDLRHAAKTGEPNMFQVLGVAPTMIGMLVAAISAAIAVKWLVGFLNKHGLTVFGWYRIALALVLGILVWQGVVQISDDYQDPAVKLVQQLTDQIPTAPAAVRAEPEREPMKTSFPKDKIKAVLVEGVHPCGVEMLEAEGFKVTALPKSPAPAELKKLVKDAHLLGIRSKTEVTPEILEAAPRLLAVGCFCIGTNQVALSRAGGAGVPVFNSPYSNTRSVAELTLGEILALYRKLADTSSAMHRGEWVKSAKGSHEVRGRTLGIVGYGHIGSQISILAEALGMRVIFYDVLPKLALGNARPVRSLDALLGEADVVTLHVPATAATKGLIGKAQIRAMKPGAMLINTPAARSSILKPWRTPCARASSGAPRSTCSPTSRRQRREVCQRRAGPSQRDPDASHRWVDARGAGEHRRGRLHQARAVCEQRLDDRRRERARGGAARAEPGRREGQHRPPASDPALSPQRAGRAEQDAHGDLGPEGQRRRRVSADEQGRGLRRAGRGADRRAVADEGPARDPRDDPRSHAVVIHAEVGSAGPLRPRRAQP